MPFLNFHPAGFAKYIIALVTDICKILSLLQP